MPEETGSIYVPILRVTPQGGTPVVMRRALVPVPTNKVRIRVPGHDAIITEHVKLSQPILRVRVRAIGATGQMGSWVESLTSIGPRLSTTSIAIAANISKYGRIRYGSNMKYGDMTL